MTLLREPSPVSRYRDLARQVARVRATLPVALCVIVFAVETSEHIIREAETSHLDYAVEVFLFGVAGPAIVAAVLTWIMRNLELLAQADERIETFNAELDKKIQTRTAELEQANAELRQLDRLKSDFVSLVSHELRTPLTNIRGGLEVITAEANGNSTGETLTIVQSEVNRLIRLVQRILDVSALESGQLRLNLGPVMLRPIIRHIEKESMMFDDKHPLRLEMPPLPVLVIADEDRISDVLTNLFANAIKYSPDGGPIVVRLQGGSDNAEITVKDCGVGIPQDEQQYLMNQFYRGRVGKQVAGYGLGLYFARKVIEAHGGRLWMESSGVPGEGAEFHFTLPLDKETG